MDTPPHYFIFTYIRKGFISEHMCIINTCYFLVIGAQAKIDFNKIFNLKKNLIIFLSVGPAYHLLLSVLDISIMGVYS